MEESIYNLCLFHRSGLFGIIGIQTNNTLILADNNFASKDKIEIKTTNIITKDQEHLISK